MTPEEFQQNNEHGGYPMFTQLAPKPVKRWLFIALLLFALCLAVVGVMTFARPALADPVAIPCDRLQTMLDRLEKAYGEFVVITGTLTNGKRLIVTLSSSGSFSLVETDGNMGCMVAAGEKGQIDNGI